MDFHLFIIGNPISLAIAQHIISRKKICRTNYLIITIRRALENQKENICAAERLNINLQSKPPKSIRRSTRQLFRLELFRSVSKLSKGNRIHLYLTQTRNFSYNLLIDHPLVTRFSIIEDGSASYLHKAGAVSNSFKEYSEVLRRVLKFSQTLLNKLTYGCSTNYRHNSFTPKDAVEYHCLSHLCFPGILAQDKYIHDIFEVFSFVETQNQNLFPDEHEDPVFLILDQSISSSEANIVSFLSFIIKKDMANGQQLFVKLHPSTKLTELRRAELVFNNKITLVPQHISLESIATASNARFICVNSSIYIYLKIMGKNVCRIAPEQMPRDMRLVHTIKAQKHLEALFSQFSS